MSITFATSTAITNNSKYERNSSIVMCNDGYYRVFYARADTVTQRSGGDVDNESYMIYFKRSNYPSRLDNGLRWGSPILLNATRPAGFYQRDISVIEDDLGKLWVYVSSGDSGTYRPLIYYTSTDKGSTWTAAASVLFPGTLNDPNNPLGGTRLGHSHVIYSAGTFYCVYQASGGSAIYYSKSTNGSSWSTPVQVWSTGHFVPKLLVIGAKIYLVTSEGAQGKIYLSTSMDDGFSWSKAHILGSGSAWGDWDPFIAKTFSGNLAVVWAPNVGSAGQQLRISYSTDDGVVWSTPEILTTGSEWWDYWPQIVTHGGNTGIFYTSEKSDVNPVLNGNIWQMLIQAPAYLGESDTNTPFGDVSMLTDANLAGSEITETANEQVIMNDIEVNTLQGPGFRFDSRYPLHMKLLCYDIRYQGIRGNSFLVEVTGAFGGISCRRLNDEDFSLSWKVSQWHLRSGNVRITITPQPPLQGVKMRCTCGIQTDYYSKPDR